MLDRDDFSAIMRAKAERRVMTDVLRLARHVVVDHSAVVRARVEDLSELGLGDARAHAASVAL